MTCSADTQYWQLTRASLRWSSSSSSFVRSIMGDLIGFLAEASPVKSRTSCSKDSTQLFLRPVSAEPEAHYNKYLFKVNCLNTAMQSTSRNQLEIFCHYEESLGRCSYGDCYAKHKNSTENESVPSLCKSWQEGKCMRWRCRDRHYYTDDDDVLPQSKRFLDDDRGTSIMSLWLCCVSLVEVNQ